MKINITIDIQPHNTAELDRLAQLIKNIDATLSAIELEIENYRQRLVGCQGRNDRFQ